MSILDSIQNYYEDLVVAAVLKHTQNLDLGAEYLADVVCVALNHLPPRYYRHGVDMAYYTSPVERQELADKVELAVKDALASVSHDERS